MSGVFPDAGVSAGAALNSLKGLSTGNGPTDELAPGCPDLWYPSRCNGFYDPAAMNAMISEFMKVLTDRGEPYDCNLLDNLSRAIGPHLISYEKSVNFPVDPWPVKNGNDTILTGSFTVPNSSGREMRVLAISQLTLLIKILVADRRLDVNLTLSDDNSFTGRLLYTTLQLRNLGSADLTSFISIQPIKTNILNIPAGGRKFFYRLATEANGGAAFELKEDYDSMKWRFYGVSHLSADILSE